MMKKIYQEASTYRDIYRGMMDREGEGEEGKTRRRKETTKRSIT